MGEDSTGAGAVGWNYDDARGTLDCGRSGIQNCTSEIGVTAILECGDAEVFPPSGLGTADEIVGRVLRHFPDVFEMQDKIRVGYQVTQRITVLHARIVGPGELN